MDKNTLIKWALIAGAAYLVYRYAVSQGWIGGSTTAVGNASSTGTITATTSSTGTAATASTSTPNRTTSEVAASILAVPGFYYDGGGNTQNAYQWNYWWMRSSVTNNKNAAPAELGVDPDLQMTVDEYAQRVVNLYFSTSGVSGLGLLRLPSPAFAAAWKM
jgi:hypothetical protein